MAQQPKKRGKYKKYNDADSQLEDVPRQTLWRVENPQAESSRQNLMESQTVQQTLEESDCPNAHEHIPGPDSDHSRSSERLSEDSSRVSRATDSESAEGGQCQSSSQSFCDEEKSKENDKQEYHQSEASQRGLPSRRPGVSDVHSSSRDLNARHCAVNQDDPDLDSLPDSSSHGMSDKEESMRDSLNSCEDVDSNQDMSSGEDPQGNFDHHPVGDDGFHNIESSDDSNSENGSEESEQDEQDDNQPQQPHPFQPPVPYNLNLREKLREDYYSVRIEDRVAASRGEVLLNIQEFCRQHPLPLSAQEDLHKLVNSIFYKEVVPSTKYKLDKLYSVTSSIRNFFYCSKCFVGFGELDYKVVKLMKCIECNTWCGSFLKHKTVSEVILAASQCNSRPTTNDCYRQSSIWTSQWAFCLCSLRAEQVVSES